MQAGGRSTASAIPLQPRNEIVNADGVRAIGEKTLISIALILRTRQPDPELDLSLIHDLLEVRGMTGHKPLAECVLQAPRVRAEPMKQAVVQDTGCSAKRLAVVRKYELGDAHRRPRMSKQPFPTEHTREGERMEAVGRQPTTTQIVQATAQLQLGIEAANGKTEIGLFSQGVARVERRMS